LRDYAESIEAFKQGLTLEPESAILKRGLAEVEKAQDKDAAEGEDPMGKMFSDPNMIAKVCLDRLVPPPTDCR
jgi:hypothetical protein